MRRNASNKFDINRIVGSGLSWLDRPCRERGGIVVGTLLCSPVSRCSFLPIESRAGYNLRRQAANRKRDPCLGNSPSPFKLKTASVRVRGQRIYHLLC